MKPVGAAVRSLTVWARAISSICSMKRRVPLAIKVPSRVLRKVLRASARRISVTVRCTRAAALGVIGRVRVAMSAGE